MLSLQHGHSKKGRKSNYKTESIRRAWIATHGIGGRCSPCVTNQETTHSYGHHCASPSLPHHITSHQSLMQQRGSRTMTSRSHHTMCLCPSWDSIGRGGSGRGQLRYMVTPHQQHITVTHTTGRRPVSTRMRNPLQWSTLPKYSGQKGIA